MNGEHNHYNLILILIQPIFILINGTIIEVLFTKNIYS